MNVDRMRKVDRLLGIPITFIFTILLKIKRLFCRYNKNKAPDVSRVLLIELSEMGSVVIADPAMRKLQHEGNSELFFVIFKDNAKSLSILNTVSEKNIFLMRSDNLFVLIVDVLKFICWCRKQKITTTIDLELFSRFTALLSGFSGAASRIGFTTLHDEGCYRGDIFTHLSRYNSHIHMVKNFMSLINTALNLNTEPYPTYPILDKEIELKKLSFNEDERIFIREKIRSIYPDFKQQRIILINPNSSDLLPQRSWLIENFCKVIQDILEDYQDILILITGASHEHKNAENLLRQVNNKRCLNTAGEFTFDELFLLYDISTLMLTNDSGPGHFSAVTSLKVFIIFGPETPQLYGSLGNSEYFYLALPCSPCVSAHNHRKTSCITRPCITGITPDMVLERLSPLLRKIKS
jgi:ADP-heptose:LPS heptosyltransferase